MHQKPGARDAEQYCVLSMMALRHVKLLVGAVVVFSCHSACSSTSPSCTDQFGRGQTGLTEVVVHCSASSSNLQCQAVQRSTGFYDYCPTQQDVTTSANWTSGDPTIVRSTGPGTFTAVGTGDTFVQAIYGGQSPMRPVSVFPNMPPLPTYDISGSVFQAGSTSGSSPIDGAVVQILDGLVAGRIATSSVPPPLLPGYSGPVGGRGFYRLLGVPPGTYHLQVTKSGYVSQQGTVTVVGPGGALLDFPLQPS